MSGRLAKLKGFKVTRKGSKVILEPIATYGRDASARIRARKSTKQRVVRRVPS